MPKSRRTSHSHKSIKGAIAEAKTFLRPDSPTWGEVCERSLPMPAASQAALEMPEDIALVVRMAHGESNSQRVRVPDTDTVIRWLADRVAELERELGHKTVESWQHKSAADKFCRELCAAEKKLFALQSSAAQETKLPDTEKAKMEPPRPIATGADLHLAAAYMAKPIGRWSASNAAYRVDAFADALDQLHATEGLAEAITEMERDLDVAQDRYDLVSIDGARTILDALRCVYSPTEPST